jgi:hypothetical protein
MLLPVPMHYLCYSRSCAKAHTAAWSQAPSNEISLRSHEKGYRKFRHREFQQVAQETQSLDRADERYFEPRESSLRRSSPEFSSRVVQRKPRPRQRSGWNAARGLVKSYGERLRKCGTEQVRRETTSGLSTGLREALEPLLREVESLNERIQEYDRRIAEMAGQT